MVIVIVIVIVIVAVVAVFSCGLCIHVVGDLDDNDDDDDDDDGAAYRSSFQRAAKSAYGTLDGDDDDEAGAGLMAADSLGPWQVDPVSSHSHGDGVVSTDDYDVPWVPKRHSRAAAASEPSSVVGGVSGAGSGAAAPASAGAGAATTADVSHTKPPSVNKAKPPMAPSSTGPRAAPAAASRPDMATCRTLAAAALLAVTWRVGWVFVVVRVCLLRGCMRVTCVCLLCV